MEREPPASIKPMERVHAHLRRHGQAVSEANAHRAELVGQAIAHHDAARAELERAGAEPPAEEG